MPAIDIAATGDTITYLIHDTPASLPPVSRRDLLAAWDAARQAALDSCPQSGPPSGYRAFRFARPDGGTTDLALSDTDACCWADAVDAQLSLATAYGLSVCLRLLALIGLLAAAPWARHHIRLHRTGADLHPALLRLAAEAKLTDEAGFDERAFRARLNPALTPSAPRSGQGATPC